MQKIPLIEKGSFRTLLQRGLANTLLSAVNALLSIQGAKGSGITVTPSEAGFVIDWDGESTGSSTPPTVNETGTLVWAGPWQDVAYAKDVLVSVDTDDDREDGTIAGQYASLQAVPAGTPKPGTTGSAA